MPNARSMETGRGQSTSTAGRAAGKSPGIARGPVAGPVPVHRQPGWQYGQGLVFGWGSLSPDGTKLVYSGADERLYILEVAGKQEYAANQWHA